MYYQNIDNSGEIQKLLGEKDEMILQLKQKAGDKNIYLQQCQIIDLKEKLEAKTVQICEITQKFNEKSAQFSDMLDKVGQCRIDLDNWREKHDKLQ